MLFIVVAVLFGLYIKYAKPNGKLQFVIGIVLLIAMLAVGIKFHFILVKMYGLLLYLYIFLAAIAPMWILMQPRDYLSSFLLIGMIVAQF